MASLVDYSSLAGRPGPPRSETRRPSAGGLGSPLHGKRHCIKFVRPAQSARPRRAGQRAHGQGGSAPASGGHDALIDTLLAVQDTPSFQEHVADNILGLNKEFWLHLAARRDAVEAGGGNPAALDGLAEAATRLLGVLVQESDRQARCAAGLLHSLLTAAADPVTGEWEATLPLAKQDAMRQTLERRRGELDDSFAATACAWMRKAASDGHHGARPAQSPASRN